MTCNYAPSTILFSVQTFRFFHSLDRQLVVTFPMSSLFLLTFKNSINRIDEFTKTPVDVRWPSETVKRVAIHKSITVSNFSSITKPIKSVAHSSVFAYDIELHRHEHKNFAESTLQR